ncbi:BnaA02g11020D [Brassica napus]|uniref:BnaA02g11020D protein n=1 Tax=Brassica napus TaxID=3708 RepID=A0A078GPG8_BRANA|nr:BnaA02g11020D [Brassica napus]
MHPNQVEIDEALAASLLYDDPESTICDTVTLRQIQQQQVMIPPLRVCPPECPQRIVCPYCPVPYPHGHDSTLPFVCMYCPIPYFHVHDCPPSREAFTGHFYGNSSTDMYRRSFSDIGSSSGHGDSENMTLEVVNELIESVGDVNRGLPQSKVSRLPTHKYGEIPKCRWWWEKKKKFVSDDSQCSICLIDYEKGDRITTLTPCNHIYHTDCISEWLKKSAVCVLITSLIDLINFINHKK